MRFGVSKSITHFIKMKYIKNGERFAASRTVCAVKETRVKFPPGD